MIAQGPTVGPVMGGRAQARWPARNGARRRHLFGALAVYEMRNDPPRGEAAQLEFWSRGALSTSGYKSRLVPRGDRLQAVDALEAWVRGPAPGAVIPERAWSRRLTEEQREGIRP